MSLSEFELIRTYFYGATGERDDVVLGIGDDCALLRPRAGELVAAGMDTLVAGRHFREDVAPETLGHKALAVNLSDLAAVGAEPAWATLSLTLPRADTTWLAAFMQGFSALATAHGVQLVGGDTTRGPLSITVQVQGFVDESAALKRSAGHAGDRLLVSGTLGDAGLALQYAHAGKPVDAELRERLDRPTPRVTLGRLLAGQANAAIDISDGLLADLGHICAGSGTGAHIELDRLPLSAAVRDVAAAGDWSAPLGGGDDYELLFSVDPARLDEIVHLCRSAGERVAEIGELVQADGIKLIGPEECVVEGVPSGFDHFRD